MSHYNGLPIMNVHFIPSYNILHIIIILIQYRIQRSNMYSKIYNVKITLVLYNSYTIQSEKNAQYSTKVFTGVVYTVQNKIEHK